MGSSSAGPCSAPSASACPSGSPSADVLLADNGGRGRGGRQQGSARVPAWDGAEPRRAFAITLSRVK